VCLALHVADQKRGHQRPQQTSRKSTLRRQSGSAIRPALHGAGASSTTGRTGLCSRLGMKLAELMAADPCRPAAARRRPAAARRAVSLVPRSLRNLRRRPRIERGRVDGQAVEMRKVCAFESLSGHIARSSLRSSDLLPFYHQYPAACCGDFLLCQPCHQPHRRQTHPGLCRARCNMIGRVSAFPQWNLEILHAAREKWNQVRCGACSKRAQMGARDAARSDATHLQQLSRAGSPRRCSRIHCCAGEATELDRHSNGGRIPRPANRGGA
jgi:hypothetical protein